MEKGKIYRYNQVHNVAKEFEKYFHERFEKFFSKEMRLLSCFSNQVLIDVLAFDDYLHEKWGDYETEHGWSMKQCIKEHYGKDAAKFFESLI